jgi:hypothetical protein
MKEFKCAQEILTPQEYERLTELSRNFQSVAKRRRKLDDHTKKTMLECATHDLLLFSSRLIRVYEARSFPVITEIVDFMKDWQAGAPKYIDISLRRLPPEIRLPYVPAEHAIRNCRITADTILYEALRTFD